MTAPNPRRDPAETRVLRLPDVDERRIPGWRFTRHAVAWTIGIFVFVVSAGLIGATFVTMRVTVPGSGVLEPMTVRVARAREPGIITSVLVRTGDTVAAGAVLALLDSSDVLAEVLDLEGQLRRSRIELDRLVESAPIDVERSRAAVEAAEADAMSARTVLRQRMAEFGVTGDPDSIARAVDGRVHIGLDQPSANLLAAQSHLRGARAQLAASALNGIDIAQKRADVQRVAGLVAARQARLGRLAIHSPASGVVLTDQVDQLVGASVAPGASVFEIADVGTWRATLSVSERDIYRVHVGDTVDVEVPAFASLTVNRFRGLVKSVGWQPAGGASPGMPSAPGYRVVVEMDTRELAPFSGGLLRRGYAVHGEVITRSARALVLVVEYVRDRARAITR